MNSQEMSELLEEYKVTGSQSESLDIQFSPGSQDSISNIHVDFDLGFNRHVDCNDLDINVHFQQLAEVRDYMLNVSFESQTLPVTKSAAWTFSEPLKRLYVNIGQPCPIRVRLEPIALPGAFLRCFLRYQKSAYISDPVTQCANHLCSETNSSMRGHVLRCKNVGVQYDRDPASGRYSLCLPFDRSEDDVDGDTYVFEFKCLSTCLGRRAMELLFQVEYSGRIVCCHSVNVRVCSCPGRDRRHDENQLKNPHLLKSKMKSEPNALPHGGPSKRHLDDNEEFTIKVKGRKNYELMLALKQRLEMADAYESQVAEGKQDAELASPRPKMLMTTRERIPAKEQLKDQAKGLLESADADRSHHRWRTLVNSPQLQQSQHLLTGKIRKNKALPGADNGALFKA